MDVYALLCGLQAGEHGLDNAHERCATPRERAPAEENENSFCPESPRGGIEDREGRFHFVAHEFSGFFANFRKNSNIKPS
jgi:hypothetical protein